MNSVAGTLFRNFATLFQKKSFNEMSFFLAINLINKLCRHAINQSITFSVQHSLIIDFLLNAARKSKLHPLKLYSI